MDRCLFFGSSSFCEHAGCGSAFRIWPNPQGFVLGGLGEMFQRRSGRSIAELGPFPKRDPGSQKMDFREQGSQKMDFREQGDGLEPLKCHRQSPTYQPSHPAAVGVHRTLDASNRAKRLGGSPTKTTKALSAQAKLLGESHWEKASGWRDMHGYAWICD